MTKKPPIQQLVLCAIWFGAVGAGLQVMASYENTPGREGKLKLVLNPSSGRSKSPQQDTLMMFFHPQCPCSRASVAELSRIMAQCQGRLHTDIYIFQPDSLPASWARSGLWQTAAAIPGVCVFPDINGDKARGLGGLTSGEALLYSEDGRLLFHGGITEGRGHEGDNDGHDAIVSLVWNGRATKLATPVFGCPILTEQATAAPRCPHP